MKQLYPFYRKMNVVVDHMAAALEQIPESKIMWKPCERALPWLYLILHTGVHAQLFLRLMKGEPSHFPHCFADEMKRARSAARAANVLRESWERLRVYLQSRPEEFGSQKVLTAWAGPDMTVEEYAWLLFEESVHHRGQAWVYAHMNGITPPTIWGIEHAEV